MSNIKDGGPAFPLSTVDPYERSVTTCDGMTLRDYFAAKAMQGFAADPDCGSLSADDVAEIAYVWADAMLKAKEAK